MSKRRLGRGLEALIPEFKVSEDAKIETGGVVEIPLRMIKPNPQQPRRTFDQQKLEELAETLRAYGVIQPITVIQDDDHYILITGERRLKAAEMAGLKTIPALIREYGRENLMEIALVENIQREDLNPIEESIAFKALIEEFALTQEELAKRLGKSRSAITNALRLLSLNEEIQEFIINGKLTVGQARPLLSLNDKNEQLRLALIIINNKLSAREAEKLIKTEKNKRNLKVKNECEIDGAKLQRLIITEMEEKVRKVYGTRVLIKKSARGGKIELSFYSNEDLERLVDLLLKNDES